MQSDLLFILVDSVTGDDAQLGVHLANHAKSGSIVTVGICCIEDPIVSAADQRWQFLEQFRRYVDSVVIVTNVNQPSLANPEHENHLSYSVADECQSIVHSLSYIFSHRTMVGVDLADLRQMLSGSSYAVFGKGHASGTNRATIACDNAIQVIVNKGVVLKQVLGVYVQMVDCKRDLNEFTEVGDHVDPFLAEDCILVVAYYLNNLSPDDVLRLGILACGLTRDDVVAMFGRAAKMSLAVA